MSLPFTKAEFLELFAAYNTAIWPMQLAMYALGLLVIAGLGRNSRLMSKLILISLSVMWLWTAIVYHLGFFSRINPTAVLFGTLFFFEGVIFLSNGMSRKNLILQSTLSVYDITGWIFILYAMFVYPVIGQLTGHTWPTGPVFGVAPCPVVIFTFGVLLFLKARVSPIVIAIPFIWSLIGTSAAIRLGMYEDYGLPIAGIIGTAIILKRNRQLKLERITHAK